MTVEVVGFIVIHSTGRVKFFEDKITAERHAGFLELQVEPVVRAINYLGAKQSLIDAKLQLKMQATELALARLQVARLEKATVNLHSLLAEWSPA